MIYNALTNFAISPVGNEYPRTFLSSSRQLSFSRLGMCAKIHKSPINRCNYHKTLQFICHSLRLNRPGMRKRVWE
ncbi:MAG: hypothetical protein AMXMBFR75_00870 [Candidatus Hinthialibacteria bacterium]